MTNQEFMSRLNSEVELWRRERLITDELAQSLHARYQAAVSQPRPLARALAFLGAILIGVGVIVFFASNWQFMPGWAKLTLIFFAVAAAQTLGYWLYYEKTTYKGTGAALLLLGALLFGAAIFLIAQGYHVNANAPSLLLLWAIGVIPFAYLIKSSAIATIPPIILALAVGYEASYWLEEVGYGLNLFGYYAVFLLYGTVLYALGTLHDAFPAFQRFRRPYGALGLICLMSVTFVLTFASHWSWDFANRAMFSALGPGAQWRLGVLLAASIALATLSLVKRRTSVTHVSEGVALFAMILGAIGLLFLPELEVWGKAWSVGIAFVLNLLLLGMIIGVLWVGYETKETAWVNLGALYFAFLVLARYFDLAAWIPRELFFIGAGLLLMLGGAALEKTRRHIVERMEEREEASS